MRKVLLAAILLIAPSAAFAQVNALPPTPHILVFGHAQARAIPDRFKISISVSVTDPSADAARKRVQAHADQIFAGLAHVGVPKNETTATTLSIQPHSEYDAKAQKTVYQGVQVSREIGATFDDLGKLQQFLASVDASKELQISGISTGLRDEIQLREQLRGKAIESTQQKAKSIALSYGTGLVGLYSVSDVAPEVSYGVKAGAWPIYGYDAESAALDTITVSGSRMRRTDNLSAHPVTALSRNVIESLKTGYVTFEENIYAVFLIGNSK